MVFQLNDENPWLTIQSGATVDKLKISGAQEGL